MSEKPWWYPTLADDRWLARLRDDYPEKGDWSDEELINYFNEDDSKYIVLWDHVGDAYSQFEALADDYLKLQAKLDAVEKVIVDLDTQSTNSHAVKLLRKALQQEKNDE
jgi:hypothetical protein